LLLLLHLLPSTGQLREQQLADWQSGLAACCRCWAICAAQPLQCSHKTSPAWSLTNPADTHLQLDLSNQQNIKLAQ
jgi:hypothetical protein